MSASQSLQSKRAPGRRANASGSNDQTTGKSQVPSSLTYLGIALMALWVLQAVVAPLLPRVPQIPYSEFKVKLAEGHIADDTLGTPISSSRPELCRRQSCSSTRSTPSARAAAASG